MAIQFCIIQMKDGHVQNRKPLTVLLQSLKDGKYELTLQHISKRSNQQNRYLHGVLIPEFRNALYQSGYDKVKLDSQAKQVMKQMFLKAELVNKETGEVIPYTKDTSELTKEEMGVLFEEVIRFTAEEMNYQIPYPNEQLTMNYED